MIIPDYAEPLTAYRSWHAHPSGLLGGTAWTEPWPMYQPFEARCCCAAAVPEHIVGGVWQPAPVFACGCGVYAFKTTQIAREHLAMMRRTSAAQLVVLSNRNESYTLVPVFGTVRLWGRVIEHEDGYRAQYAYPADLACASPTLAQRIRDLYGVPCGADVALAAEPEPTWLEVEIATSLLRPGSTIVQAWGSQPAVVQVQAPNPIARLSTFQDLKAAMKRAGLIP